MRYDKDNDPWSELNSSLLDNTPIGTLRVVTQGNAAGVAVMDPQDPTRVQRIIHTLGRKENPLQAIYGKRLQEQDAVAALYASAKDTRDKTEALDNEDLSKDFVNALDRFERRNDEGKEAVIGFAGLGHVEVRRDS